MIIVQSPLQSPLRKVNSNLGISFTSSSELFIRNYRNDEYHSWVTDKIAGRMSLEGVFATPEKERDTFINLLGEMYDGLPADNKPFSEYDLLSCKTRIIDLCYIFHPFQGAVEEITQDHIDFGRFPKRLKDRLLSGKKDTMISVSANKQDKFIMDCLAVFVQLRMVLLCLGSAYTYDELYSKAGDPLLRSYMLGGFIARNISMPPCCLGCYINLYQFIAHLDRDLLSYRLNEYIASPEVLKLLENLIYNSVIYLDKNKPGLQEALISNPKGLVQGGALSNILYDFYLDEFDFYLSRVGFYYSRLDHEIFIGIPIKEIDNSTLDVIKQSVVSNITEALHKMRMDHVDTYLSFHFIEEGGGIPLYGGELKLRSGQFEFDNNNPHDY